MCEVVHSSVVAREVVELHYVLIAFASDTTALYLLAKDLGLLGDKEKAREWAAMTEMVTKATPLGKQFPWIIPLGEKIPLSVVRVMNPVVAGLLSLGQVRSYLLSPVFQCSIPLICGLALVRMLI